MSFLESQGKSSPWLGIEIYESWVVEKGVFRVHKASSSILDREILILRCRGESLRRLLPGINGALVSSSGFVGLLSTSTLLLYLQTLLLRSVSKRAARGGCQLPRWRGKQGNMGNVISLNILVGIRWNSVNFPFFCSAGVLSSVLRLKNCKRARSFFRGRGLRDVVVQTSFVGKIL